jgi:hypothetical protein
MMQLAFKISIPPRLLMLLALVATAALVLS